MRPVCDCCGEQPEDRGRHERTLPGLLASSAAALRRREAELDQRRRNLPQLRGVARRAEEVAIEQDAEALARWAANLQETQGWAIRSFGPGRI